MKMSSETREPVRNDAPTVLHKPPPLTAKIFYSIILYAGKSLAALSRGLKGLKEVIWPPNGRPDLIKTYQCRPHLPVRSVKPIISHGERSLIQDGLRAGSSSQLPTMRRRPMSILFCLL